MFYATFKGLNRSDIAEFRTEQERKDWVAFRDQFSIDCNCTPDNCTFGRIALNDKNIIDSVINDNNIPTAQDEFLPNIKWYLQSIA